MSKKTDQPSVQKREVGEKVKLTLGFESASTKDLGDGVLEAIITTSAMDRHNENIETTGITYKDYMNNPVVLYGHDYEGLPIGKTLKLTKQMGTQIKARFQLAVEEYPFAATVYEMIKSGYLNAVSIGGIVREWSEDYRTIVKMDMVEFSVVPVPANPEALITSRSLLEKAAGKPIEQIRTEYLDFSQKILVDKVADMGETEVNQAIKVLENLVAALKESAKANSTAGTSAPQEVKRIKHITLRDSAKAVATQSQRIIKIVKVKPEE